MNIRFIGHMSQATDGANSFAVVFKVPKHVPRLIVVGKHIVGHTGDPDEIVCFALAGRTITFTTTGGTATAVDLSGLVPVPSLMVLGGINRVVHTNAKARKPGGNFNAFVNVPFGSYGIEDFFPKKATFNGKDFFCMPRVITFDAPSTATFIVSGLASALTVTKDAEVTITNLEISATSAHFHLHGTLFDPPIPAATIKTPSQTGAPVCLDGTDEPDVPECPDAGEEDLSVECSNTRYP
jgi:hypothetical protein